MNWAETHRTDTERPAAPPPEGALRCTDADRERTAGWIHEAAGDGRLTVEETDDRLGQVYAARFHHELDGLTADLAAPTSAPLGWPLVATHVGRQLRNDAAVLIGRAPGSRVERLRVLIVALVLLALVATSMIMLAHGMSVEDPGVEHGYQFERG